MIVVRITNKIFVGTDHDPALCKKTNLTRALGALGYNSLNTHLPTLPQLATTALRKHVSAFLPRHQQCPLPPLGTPQHTDRPPLRLPRKIAMLLEPGMPASQSLN